MSEYAGKRLVAQRIAKAAKRARAISAKPKRKTPAQLVRDYKRATGGPR